ncbi:MAG: EF-hand domain-containing protein, partial [Planctomycetales bacterium]|nr:EF-hand domain-containing protein [Planctomycetales bacterium]
LDRSAIGVHFASADPAWRPERVVRTAGISNRRIRIPAGASGHLETSTGVIARAMEVQAFMPHMHLRGAAFRFDRVDAAGARSTLLDVPRYDFNWQTAYCLTPALPLPQGTRIHCSARFDNSEANWNNPDPTQTVHWGDQTWDEMMIGYFHYAVPRGVPLEGKAIAAGDRVERLFRRFDVNHDGKIEWEETPPRRRELFERLDRDHDKILTMEEVAGVLLLQ